MERRAGRYRGQLLFQSKRRPPLHELLERLLERIPRLGSSRRVRWALDVDPLEL
jgi:primosomal protein N' (replication factor Y)